jgi:hypothetical protein
MAPPPNPPTTIPITVPLRDGNHFIAVVNVGINAMFYKVYSIIPDDEVYRESWNIKK